MAYKGRYGTFGGVFHRGGGENNYESGAYSSNQGGVNSEEPSSMSGGNYANYDGGNSAGRPQMPGGTQGGGAAGGNFGGGAAGGNYGGAGQGRGPRYF